MDTNAQSRDPVKLVVKAPNQQFEDQTVECESQWSVKKLKEHLAEVYPCKPKLEEQKLIYSGQLLKDHIILKDILRHYDDPEPQFHILHLVYTPKNYNLKTLNSSKLSNKIDATSNDGVRQRHLANQNYEMQSQNVNNVPANMTANNYATSTGVPSGNCSSSGPLGRGVNNISGFGFPQQPNQYMLAQQMAMQTWMQQAYIQYMNQYMNLLSEGMRPEAVFMQHQAQPQMPCVPQNVPFAPNFGQSMPGANLAAQAAAGAADTPQIPNPGDNAQHAPAAAVVAGAVPQQPQAQNQQAPAQPRFPNIVQENPEENRDWLDVFYSLIRVMVLLTLVYFYSSALRCAAVIFIGLTIYLYHTGFFRRRLQQAREANNNNVAAAVENIQQQQQQRNNPEGNNQPGQEANEPLLNGGDAAANLNRDRSEVASSSVPEAPEANGTSVIAFVRTFVVSFFVSLLPETPAL